MPPPLSVINDPEQWRSRAEEARTIAEQMNDLTSKEAMLRIAADYGRLAKRAEERAQRDWLEEQRVQATKDATHGVPRR